MTRQRRKSAGKRPTEERWENGNFTPTLKVNDVFVRLKGNWMTMSSQTRA